MLLFLAVIVLITVAPSFFGRKDKPGDKKRINNITSSEKISYPDFNTNTGNISVEPKQLQFLKENGFIVGNKEYNQIFEPYVKPEGPVFITSDTIINAYNVINEEYMHQLENSQAKRLPVLLKKIYIRINSQKPPIRTDTITEKQANEKLRFVIGTALMLLDEKIPETDKKLLHKIKTESVKIHKAEGIDKPELFQTDKGFSGINYGIFKPTGFYTKTHSLTSYYQALKWLQTVPFRPGYNDEITALLILGGASSESGLRNEVGEFISGLNPFIPIRDNPDLSEIIKIAGNPENRSSDLKTFRESIIKNPNYIAKINDSLRTNDQPEKQTINFRIFSAYRLPENEIFSQTTKDGRNPTGLETAIFLGSTEAENLLNKYDPQNAKSIMEIISQNKNTPSQENLYNNYLNSLAILFKSPDTQAPDFMKGRLWQIKNLQTVLSGWSLMRHSLTLQVKMNTIAYCRQSKPIGFIEPVPEFYAAFAKLTEKTEKCISENKIMQTTDTKEEQKSMLLDYANLLRKQHHNKLSPYEETKLGIYEFKLEIFTNKHCKSKKPLPKAAELEKIASDIMSKTKYYNRISGDFPDDKTDFRQSLTELKKICLKLEELSKKQLQGLEFTNEENDFIKNYGETLAGTMFYKGNSYLEPIDDAPRITVFAFNPTEKSYKLAGTSKPKSIYVLYPWKGKSILCKGAVMSYCEFTSPAPLNDEEWREKIRNSKKGRFAPAWAKEIEP